MNDVNVMCKNDGDMSITISKPACLGQKECQKVILPIISSMAGKICCPKQCVRRDNRREECALCFQPIRHFVIDVKVAKVPKEGSVLSGDSQCVIELPDAKVALILSDGMGTGPNAAIESEAVTANLRQLLQAGFDKDFAIRW